MKKTLLVFIAALLILTGAATAQVPFIVGTTGNTGPGGDFFQAVTSQTILTGATWTPAQGTYIIYPDRFSTIQINTGTVATPAWSNITSTLSTELYGSGTLTFTSIAAATCQEQTLTVTGALTGDVAAFSPGATLGNTNLSWSSWVSAANTVSVRVCNPTAGAITPAAVTWNGWDFQTVSGTGIFIATDGAVLRVNNASGSSSTVKYIKMN